VLSYSSQDVIGQLVLSCVSIKSHTDLISEKLDAPES
jgi:hypothetical protein